MGGKLALQELSVGPWAWRVRAQGRVLKRVDHSGLKGPK